MAGGHVKFTKFRRRWLVSTGQICAALMVLASVGVMTRPAAAATTATWTGASTVDNNWTTGANCAGGTAPASGSDLVFPDVAATCSAGASSSDCYTSNNDEPAGFTVNSIRFPASDAAHANSILYTISGNAITLGAGGLTDEMSNDNTAQIDSLVLAADQTWTLHGGENFGVNNPLTATSLTNPASLEVNLGGVDGNGPTLDLFGDNELGATTFPGADPAQTGQHAGNNGIVVLTPDDSGNASLNTTTGKPVTFTNVELDGQARFPALTVHGGDIQVGNQPVGSSGTLGNVQAKSVNLDSGTLVDFPISGPASGSPTAGTDYSQIKATGAVDLGGAQLAIENFDTDARL